MKERQTSEYEQKQEAIKRLKLLQVPDDIVQDFAEEDRIVICTAPLGVYRNIIAEEIRQINHFEINYNTYVYLGIQTILDEENVLNNWFFVSDYKKEWPQEAHDLSTNATYAYVYNMAVPEYSEIGLVGFKHGGFKGTGLVRVY